MLTFFCYITEPAAVEYTQCIPIGGGRTPTPTSDCSGYDIKQSDWDARLMLEIWEMQSNPSLLLLPGLL